MSEIKALEKLREKIQLDVNNPWSDLKGDLLKKVDKVEAEVERDYMALPKDADGVRIEIGDRLHEHEDGHEFVADGLKIWGSDREWWAYQENGIQAPVSRCTHVKPRTLEDILALFLTAVGDDDPHYYDEQIAEYADEIRAMFGEVGE